MGRLGCWALGMGTHLLGDLQLEVLLYRVKKAALAAGIQHTLLDATLVAWHGVDEHCGEWSGGAVSCAEGNQETHLTSDLGCSRPAENKALQWPLTHRLKGVTLMGVLVEEEVVAGGISGNSGGQLGHFCGLCMYQLDGLPLQVQLLWRGRGRHEGTLLPDSNPQCRTGWQAEVSSLPLLCRIHIPLMKCLGLPCAAPLQALLEERRLPRAVDGVV